MSKNKFLVAVGSLFCVFFATSFTFACACCVDPGYYEITTIRSNFYEKGFLDEMKFDTAAELYQTVAGFDVIRGLNDLRKDQEAGRSIDLSVDEKFLGHSWQLKLNTTSNRGGSLVLPMPQTMVRYKVDQHDNAPNTETVLYKELRFKGYVGSGTGIFKSANERLTSYFLVFQGKGNGCDSSSDFKNWRLEIAGPKAKYAFYGKLNP